MNDYRYKHKNYLMTASEHDFFKILIEVIGQGYYIFPQIHLGTITRPNMRWTYKWKLWEMAFLSSDKYSVDYVICDNNAIKPLLVIELDDASHLREKRRTRDRVVEEILKEAGLAILRFTHTEAKNREFVENKIGLHFAAIGQQLR